MDTVNEDKMMMEKMADAANFKEALRRRLMAYYELLKQYQRAREPDKGRLSDLVIKAKGPKRSMRKFAEEIEVNPSTLSRLVNQKTTGANSDELIAKIAAHADPDSGVTFEELMEAHGMALKEARYRNESAFEDACRDILLKELEIRGYETEDEACERLRGAGFGMEYDFALRTDALKKGNGKWYFECKMFNSPSGIPVGAGRTMQWLTMTMALFYCGGMDAEKVSLVVERREIYESLKERCKDVKIPDQISVILVDTEKQRVVEEFLIPMTGDGEQPEVFYKISDQSEIETMQKSDDAWDMSVFDGE